MHHVASTASPCQPKLSPSKTNQRRPYAATIKKAAGCAASTPSCVSARLKRSIWYPIVGQAEQSVRRRGARRSSTDKRRSSQDGPERQRPDHQRDENDKPVVRALCIHRNRTVRRHNSRPPPAEREPRRSRR